MTWRFNGLSFWYLGQASQGAEAIDRHVPMQAGHWFSVMTVRDRTRGSYLSRVELVQ